MVDLYVTLIINKRPGYSFENVPKEYKDEVRKKLRDAGYDTNGDRITEP